MASLFLREKSRKRSTEKRALWAVWQAGETQESYGRGIISPIELRHDRTIRLAHWLLFAFLIFLALSTIFPLYWLFTGALKTPIEFAMSPPTFWPANPSWDNYVQAWNAADWPRALLNTVVLAAGSWCLNTLVSSSAAYSFSRIRPKYYQVVFFLFMCTLMIPGVVLSIPQYANLVSLPLVHVNLIGTPLAIWLPAAFGAGNIFLYKIFFDRVSSELTDSARLEGASHWTIYTRICLPLIKPALVIGLIFSFIGDWSAFFWPLLVLNQSGWEPIGLVLYTALNGKDQTIQVAGAAMATIVPFILVAIFQNEIIKTNTAYANAIGK